ncbi:MAG: cobalamin-dependent protein, partial [Leptospiraceae bacterium]|nr:cobalamin-dependent protein [Leptospiraceae bacterium]
MQTDRRYLELAPDPQAWPPGDEANGVGRVLLFALNVPGYYSHPARLLSLMICEDPDLNQKWDARYFEADTDFSLARCVSLIDAWQVDIIGLSVNIWNCSLYAELTRSLHDLDRRPLLVGGGQEVTNSVYDFLKTYPHYDYIIDGEGELPLRQLLLAWDPALRDLKDKTLVSGLVYRQNEQSIRNRPADVVSDLDQLPSPVLANMMPAGSDNKNGLGIML